MQFIILIPFAIIAIIACVLLAPFLLPFHFIYYFFSTFFKFFNSKKHKIESLFLAKYVFYFSLSGFLMYTTWLSWDFIANQEYFFHNTFQKINIFFPEKNYMMFFFEKPTNHFYLWYFINIFHPLMFIIFILSSWFWIRNKKVLTFYNSEVIPSKAYEWYDLSKNDFIQYFLKNSKFHNRKNKKTYIKSERNKTKEEKMGEVSENKHERFLIDIGHNFSKQFHLESSAFYGNADFLNLKRKIIQEIKSTNAAKEVIDKYKIPNWEKQLKTYLFMSSYKKEVSPSYKKGELVIFKMKNEESNIPIFLKKKNIELSSFDYKKLAEKDGAIKDIKERAIMLKSVKKSLKSLGL